MPLSLEDWLNENRLARFVVEVIDQLDLSNLAQQFAGRGSKAQQDAMLQRGFSAGTRESYIKAIHRMAGDSMRDPAG